MANIKVNGIVRNLELLYKGFDELFDILAEEEEYEFDDDDVAFVMDEAQYERIERWVVRERRVLEVIEKDPTKRVVIDHLKAEDHYGWTLEEIQELEYEVLGL